MRETKDQMITRLKRVISDLTKQLKDANKLIKSTKREERINVFEIEKKYKVEIANLRNEIVKLNDDFEKERDVWRKELEDTKQRLLYWRDKCENKTKNEEEQRFAKNQSIFEREKQEMDRVRLEYFEGGLCCDKYHFHFFDPYTLIIKINPYTGEELDYIGVGRIINLIKNDLYYIQKLDEVRKRLEIYDINEDVESQQLVYNMGIDIYKNLYMDFPFGEYSI